MRYREITNTINASEQGYVAGEARGTVNNFYFLIKPEESPSGILARLRLYDSQRQMETDAHNFFVEYKDWAFVPDEPVLKTGSRFAMRETGANRRRSEDVLEWLQQGGKELAKLGQAYEAIHDLLQLGYLDTIRGQLKSEAEVARQYSSERLAEQRISVSR